VPAPSAPIYEACEALAPWGEPGIEYHLVLLVTADLDLPDAEAVLFFDTGLDAVGVAPEAFDDVDVIDLPAGWEQPAPVSRSGSRSA
jgi:hypothetical protein